jgi:hypothetical protein
VKLGMAFGTHRDGHARPADYLTPLSALMHYRTTALALCHAPGYRPAWLPAWLPTCLPAYRSAWLPIDTDCLPQPQPSASASASSSASAAIPVSSAPVKIGTKIDPGRAIMGKGRVRDGEGMRPIYIRSFLLQPFTIQALTRQYGVPKLTTDHRHTHTDTP